MLCAVFFKHGESFFQVTILLDFYNCMSRLKLETYLKKLLTNRKVLLNKSSVYNVESHYCHCWKVTVAFVFIK